MVYQKRTEDGGLPEPVRPPSGPAWSPLPPASPPRYRLQAGRGPRVVAMDTRGDSH